jgi:hypothetical protein
MSTVTQTPPEIATMVREAAVERMLVSANRAASSFEATPDEKLDFKPSETANSIREIMLHLIDGNGHVGEAVGLEPRPYSGPTDKESLKTHFLESSSRLGNHLKGLSNESIDSEVTFFGMPFPMMRFLFVNEWHITRHTGQMEYIQTIWGDLDTHG